MTSEMNAQISSDPIFCFTIRRDMKRPTTTEVVRMTHMTVTPIITLAWWLLIFFGGPGLWPPKSPVGIPAGGPVIVAKPGGGPVIPAGKEKPAGGPVVSEGMGMPAAEVMAPAAAVRMDVPTEAAAAAASAVMRDRISGGGPLPSVGNEKPAGGPARSISGRRGILCTYVESIDQEKVARGLCKTRRPWPLYLSGHEFLRRRRTQYLHLSTTIMMCYPPFSSWQGRDPDYLLCHDQKCTKCSVAKRRSFKLPPLHPSYGVHTPHSCDVIGPTSFARYTPKHK